MSDVKLCRICVRKDVKMYEHDRYQLKLYYNDVTGSKISKRDCLPKWFCFECAAFLHKFYEFKRKCLHSQKAFKKLLETGCANIENISRRYKLLDTQSHLQIVSAAKNKCVKTYTLKHGEIVHDSIKSKIHRVKSKLLFTEVFVDDVKGDTEVSRNLFIEDKTPNNDKSTAIISPIQNDENNDSINNDFDQNDENNDSFNNDFDPNNVNNDSVNNDTVFNEGSNDSMPINNSNDLEKDSKEETNNVEAKINDIEEKNSLDEQTGYVEQTNNITEGIYKIGRRSSTTAKSSYSKDKTTCVIKSTTNLHSPHKPNLDNKFQRSVKKKFLDENHWTKITLTDEEATRRFQSKAFEQKYLKADFKCTDCYRTFSQQDMMKRHVKLRHCESLGPNECRHCHMRFKWKSRLQKHLKEHYTIYKCLRCELSFPVEISAFQHDYSHNGVTLTCAHCGQGFRHSSTYYTHLRKHKSAHVCSLCGVSFVSQFGLFMHKRVKHVIHHDSNEEISNTYCKVCDIKFDTLKGYEEHFSESALHATDVDGVMSQPLKTRCTKKRIPRISTTCASCGKLFSTYAAFTKHHLSLHSELPLPKSKTDKSDEQRQICEVCGITLASAWSLVNHLNTHSRNKQYTCKSCGMQLSSRSVLRRHQSMHCKNSSYVCNECSARFNSPSALRLHMRTQGHSLGRTRKKKAESQNVIEYFKNYESLVNYR